MWDSPRDVAVLEKCLISTGNLILKFINFTMHLSGKMSPIQHPKDMIDEIVRKINEFESYADKSNQKIFSYEHDYRIMLQKILENNEIDETSCREIKNCLNRLLHTTTQISLERIKLVEIKEKINKIIHEINNKRENMEKKSRSNL